MWGIYVTTVRALLVANSRNPTLSKLEQRELFSLLNPKKSEQARCRESRVELVISDPDEELQCSIFCLCFFLHFAFILLHWNPAFFLWQQHDHCQWPAPHLTPSTQIPSLAWNAKNFREETMFQLRSDAHSRLNQVGYMGLLVYVKPCSASTAVMCERRGWGQYFGVEDTP